MAEEYFQKHYNDDKKPAKLLCLGLCILLDLIVLSGIIACLSTKKYLDLVVYAVIAIVAIAIRIISLFFTYQIVLHYKDGKFSIAKQYPIKEILLFDDHTSQLNIKKYDGEIADTSKKIVRLCPKSCDNGLYVIELSKRKYLIHIDNYLFSLIDN